MIEGMKASLSVMWSDSNRERALQTEISAATIRLINAFSLVDEITYKKASEAADTATQSAILGPFFRTDHPVRPKGANIHITKGEGAEQLYFFGQVVDAKSGTPLANASVDVWMASTNGEEVPHRFWTHPDAYAKAQACMNSRMRTRWSTICGANS